MYTRFLQKQNGLESRCKCATLAELCTHHHSHTWATTGRYNIIVVGGVGVVMYSGFNLAKTQPDVAYALLSVCMLVAAGGAVNFIMVPKILAILGNEQVEIADLTTTAHELVRSSPSKEVAPPTGSGREHSEGPNPSSELEGTAIRDVHL